MKQIFLTLGMIVACVVSSHGQFGFVPEYLSGNLNLRDLTDPSNFTFLGTGPSNLGGSDFGADGKLYGLSAGNNNLYEIDTSTANYTLIGTVAPPGSEFWTGMALDPTDGQMYICSTDGNSSSFYTIDLTTAEKTLIGTNTNDDGVVGIAFDDTGQMYAIYLVRKFYKINKANAIATLVGSLTTACSAGVWHGLDFCRQNQTMYMVSYNSFNFDNELWTIDLSNGSNTKIGSVENWTGTIATRPIETLTANFEADTTLVCQGHSVAFTDLSTGNPTSWSWTFEGGTPAVSTDQNPVVTYDISPGQYDVTLTVSNANSTDTIEKLQYISVVVCAGNVDHGNLNNRVVITPNPFTDYLHLTVPGHMKSTVQFALFDQQGKKVCSGSFSGSDYTLQTRSLVPGIYLLRLSGSGLSKTVKVMKQ